jgi:hypothetical protein
MDPIANLDAQRSLVIEARAIRDSSPDDGKATARAIDRLAEVALEFAELAGALDEWRCKGGFDPYTPPIGYETIVAAEG